MKPPKKPIAQIPKNERIVGAGGNSLLNPKSRALKTKKKKPTGFVETIKNFLK